MCRARTTPPRWGFAKVARKSGAFANSIAFAVGRPSRRATVVLGAAASRPCLLPNTAERVAAGADEDGLRAAIAADLAAHVPDADAYQTRLHTATILRAVREMRA